MKILHRTTIRLQLLLLFLALLFVAASTSGVEQNVAGTVDSRWTGPNLRAFNVDTKIHPGERVSLSATGKFCLTHTHYTYEETVFLFWHKDVTVDHHNYVDAASFPPAAAIVDSNNSPVTPEQIVSPAGTNLIVPGSEPKGVFYVGAYIPDASSTLPQPDPIKIFNMQVPRPRIQLDRGNNCGEQFLSISLTEIDASQRLNLLKSYLATKQRDPEVLKSSDLICDHLRSQFPKEVADSLVQHYDHYYSNTVANASTESLLKLALDVDPSNLKATTALANYYVRSNDPRAQQVLLDAVKKAQAAVDSNPSPENYTGLGNAYSLLAQFFVGRSGGIIPSDYEHANLYWSEAAKAFTSAKDFSALREALIGQSRVLERIRTKEALKTAVNVLGRAREIAPVVVKSRPLAVSPDGRLLLAKDTNEPGVIAVGISGATLEKSKIYHDPEPDVSWEALAIDHINRKVLIKRGVGAIYWFDPQKPSENTFVADSNLLPEGVNAASGNVIGNEGGTIKIFTADGKNYVSARPVKKTEYANAYALSPSGNRYAVTVRPANGQGTTTLIVYNIDGTVAMTADIGPQQNVLSLSLSNKGDTVLTATAPQQTQANPQPKPQWKIWNTQTAQSTDLSFITAEKTDAVSLTPAGDQVVISQPGRGLVVYGKDGNEKFSISLDNQAAWIEPQIKNINDRLMLVTVGVRDNASNVSGYFYLVDFQTRTSKTTRVDITVLESLKDVIVNESGDLTLISNAQQADYQLFSLPGADPVSNLTVYEQENSSRHYNLMNGGRYFVATDPWPVTSVAHIYDFTTKESRMFVEEGHLALFYPVGKLNRWAWCTEANSDDRRGCRIFDGFTELAYQQLDNTNRVDIPLPVIKPNEPPTIPDIAGTLGAVANPGFFPTNTTPSKMTIFMPLKISNGTLLHRDFPPESGSMRWSAYDLTNTFPVNRRDFNVTVDVPRGAQLLAFSNGASPGFLFFGGMTPTSADERAKLPKFFGGPALWYKPPRSIWWQNSTGSKVKLAEEIFPPNFNDPNMTFLGNADAFLSENEKRLVLTITESKAMAVAGSNPQFQVLKLYDVDGSGNLTEKKARFKDKFDSTKLFERFAELLGLQGFMMMSPAPPLYEAFEPNPFPRLWASSVDMKIMAIPTGERLSIYDVDSDSLLGSVDLAQPLSVGSNYVVTRSGNDHFEIWRWDTTN